MPPTYIMLDEKGYSVTRCWVTTNDGLMVQHLGTDGAKTVALDAVHVTKMLDALPLPWLTQALARRGIPMPPATEENPFFALDDVVPLPTHTPEEEALCERCYQPRYRHHRLDGTTLRCSLTNPNTYLALEPRPWHLTLRPGIRACGNDTPHSRSTTVLDRVTCPDCFAQLHAAGMGFADERDEGMMQETREELARLVPDKPTCGRCGEGTTHVHAPCQFCGNPPSAHVWYAWEDTPDGCPEQQPCRTGTLTRYTPTQAPEQREGM